jgi:putative aminopeptidase FrvX
VFGITKNIDNAEKINKLYDNDLDILEYYISNDKLSNKQDEYDNILKDTSSNDKVMEVVKEYATAFGAEFELTRKGCGIITVKGKDSSKTLGLSAHCDTLGAMVRGIGGKGELSFTKIGGPSLPTLDGEYCTVLTRDGKRYSGTFLSKSPSVHVYADSATKPRDDANMYVRLDEVVKTADDVRKLGIESGDYICIDPKTTDFADGRERMFIETS